MDAREARSVAELIDSVARGARPDLLFFWGHTPPKNGSIGRHVLSQWFPARFVVDGVAYPTAEHFMMAEKARLFGDDETRREILDAAGPAKAKELGRKVRGYDDDKWLANRFEIVVAASVAKFSQNPALREFLLGTGDRVLVEASPKDRIWGIGLAESDAAASEPAAWPGLNLLGFALMEARDRIRERPA